MKASSGPGGPVPANRLLPEPNRQVRPDRGTGRDHRPAAAELLGDHRDLRPGARLGPAPARRGAQRHHPWNFPAGSAGININATVPSQDRAGRPAHPETDPATGVWGQIRDQTAVVVADGGTYNQGVHGRPTALAYGAYVADVFLPMVIPFIPGTNALWDPWQGSHNGKGLTEDAFDNATKVILNQDFVSGLTQPAKSWTTSPTSRRRKADPAARTPILTFTS